MAGAKLLPLVVLAAATLLLFNTIASSFVQPQLRGAAVSASALAAATAVAVAPQTAEAMVESEASQIQSILEQTGSSIVLADGLPFAVNGGLVFVTAAFSMSIALVVWGRNGFE
eukprot:CAMPEP_0170593540 /NCGR_PEP_ID=MMETSP0224-20130122/13505_1 /TAXON_ID=285029 /ORGANISM="Togula jolla, Strain CCCM 725" /LENGTH=113 /DNA_ID=CAMNT_0010917505 /DNA_START=54 /DNA_END=393 /DNA_ORIENTATION=+